MPRHHSSGGGGDRERRHRSHRSSTNQQQFQYQALTEEDQRNLGFTTEETEYTLSPSGYTNTGSQSGTYQAAAIGRGGVIPSSDYYFDYISGTFRHKLTGEVFEFPEPAEPVYRPPTETPGYFALADELARISPADVYGGSQSQTNPAGSTAESSHHHSRHHRHRTHGSRSHGGRHHRGHESQADQSQQSWGGGDAEESRRDGGSHDEEEQPGWPQEE